MWRRVLRIARDVPFVKAPGLPGAPSSTPDNEDHHTRTLRQSHASVPGTPKGDHPHG